MDVEKIKLITNNFFHNSQVFKIDSIDSGLINKTYIVQYSIDGVKSKFILQCLSNIFESHEIVNTNHKLVTDHIKIKINLSHHGFDYQRWEVPSLIRCRANNLFGLQLGSDFWRAMVYIDDTYTLNNLEDKIMAYQTGLGLSKFHISCSDLDFKKLESSIKNFHNTKYYINQYFLNLKEYNFFKLDHEVNKRLQNLISSLSNHVLYVESILRSLEEKSIDLSVIHGDPKLSNFLFDIKSKHVVSLIDLDTVSSGYLLTDLADCIRSICNSAGGDPENIDNVSFDINSCKSFLNGYFSINKAHNINTFRFLPEFIYLIIFELTVRFFTDFLQSNPYFKIKYETHNLFRAEVQYRLLSSFLIQTPFLSNELRAIGVFSSSTFVSDVQKLV